GQCGGGCTPLTCAQLGAMCGIQGDGCGGMVDCGPCTLPQTCGGGGTINQCGGGCKPLTCAQLGLMCGPAGDGCGGTLDCGMCTAPQTCGGGGMPGVCGQPPDGGVACMPLTCAAQGIMCGGAGDGCGNLLDCGPCPPGQTCGGGGTPGQCGSSSCKPITCATLNANCGIIGDGCGGTIDCGKCISPETCGGTGIPWRCGVVQ
ncbi:MAG TPA: tryptophan synthase alpha chain, partial [Polyangia bacterium]